MNTSKKELKPAPEIDIERLFRELDGDGSVAVTRKDPDWARGHIRTVQINSAEPISMEWITGKFGGSKLALRVYAADGKTLIGNRTVEVCGPPRDGNGIELVRGPDGAAVPVNRLQEVQRRYNTTHGLQVGDPGQPAPPAQPAQQGAPQPAPGLDISTLLNTMIASQNTTNQTMTTMLVNRINSLEGLLTQQLRNPAQHPPGAQVGEQFDPLSNLKNTVDTIGQLEKVKDAMGIKGADPQSDTAIYTDIIKSFMELAIEDKKAKIAAAGQLPGRPAPPHQLPQPPHDGFKPNYPPEQSGQQPPEPGELPDHELLELMSKRMPGLLEKLPAGQRKSIAEQVLGQEIFTDNYDDEDEEDPPLVENELVDRQQPENDLNLDRTNGETGAGDDQECTPAEQNDDPAVMPIEH